MSPTLQFCPVRETRLLRISVAERAQWLSVLATVGVGDKLAAEERGEPASLSRTVNAHQPSARHARHHWERSTALVHRQPKLSSRRAWQGAAGDCRASRLCASARSTMTIPERTPARRSRFRPRRNGRHRLENRFVQWKWRRKLRHKTLTGTIPATCTTRGVVSTVYPVTAFRTAAPTAWRSSMQQTPSSSFSHRRNVHRNGRSGERTDGGRHRRG